MARRIMHSTDPDGPDPYEGLPSRGALRNKQHEITAELADLGLALAALSPTVRAKLELPDGLEQAISELSATSRGARVRQRRFVARQLRAYDAEALTHAVGLLDPSSAVSLARTRLIERWRDRLSDPTTGDAACEEFLGAYPTAERRLLRQMARGAIKEGTDVEGAAAKGRSATAKRRGLYQYLRECIAEADPRPAAPRPVPTDAGDEWDDEGDDSDEGDGDPGESD